MARGFDHRPAAQKETHAAQGAAGGRTQPAKVTHGDKAFGQDMQQPAMSQGQLLKHDTSAWAGQEGLRLL